jgi:tetratricopeptide (TPR) repeat protein
LAPFLLAQSLATDSSAQKAAPAAAAAGRSAGQPAHVATELGRAGVSAYRGGDYAAAALKFEQAFGIMPVPTLGLWWARALVQLGRWVEAERLFRDIAGLPLDAGDVAVQRQAQAEAAREHAELLPRIPLMSFAFVGVEPGKVQLSIDGVPVSPAALSQPILGDPGESLVEGRLGAQVVVSRVTLAPSDRQLVELAFQPHADSSIARSMAGEHSGAERNKAYRTGGWLLLGAGTGAVALSGVAGYAAWRKLDDADCSNDPCRTTNAGKAESYETLKTLSTVGYIGGGLMAAAGALLLFQFPASAQELEVSLSPGFATVRGSF